MIASALKREISPAFEDLTVVFPTLNEADSIGILLSQLSETYPGLTVIVADDGSRDQTQEVVERAKRSFSGTLKFLDRRFSSCHGLTASVCDGILESRTPYTIVMDGDLQHPIATVQELLGHLRKGAEIAIGVRERLHLNQSFLRVAITLTLTTVAHLTLLARGVRTRDPLSGFFGVRTQLFREALEAFSAEFVGEGYKVLYDFLRVARPRQAMPEVLYSFATRTTGGSKANAKHVYHFLRSICR